MQAGEVIWLLAGIGIGLTIAIGILAIVAAVDGRRLRRRHVGVAPADEALPLTPPDARPRARKPSPRPLAALKPQRKAEVVAQPVRQLEQPPSPDREPVAEATSAEPVSQVTDELLSDLAAEIARVQVGPPVAIEMPEPEPMRVVVADPTPVARPAPTMVPPQQAVESQPGPFQPVAAPVETAPEPVVVAAPSPKVPPLPKVPPARKFAPALPPRDKPGA